MVNPFAPGYKQDQPVWPGLVDSPLTVAPRCGGRSRLGDERARIHEVLLAILACFAVAFLMTFLYSIRQQNQNIVLLFGILTFGCWGAPLGSLFGKTATVVGAMLGFGLVALMLGTLAAGYGT